MHAGGGSIAGRSARALRKASQYQGCALTRRIPLGRKGEPEEVAEAVRFLIEGPEFVTGETLRVDGGRLLS